MIREGAKLVETAQDVLEELGTDVATRSSENARPPAATQAVPDASAPSGRVLTALGHDPAGIDLLARRTGLGAEVITVALVELELAGRVIALPGGLYQRRG